MTRIERIRKSRWFQIKEWNVHLQEESKMRWKWAKDGWSFFKKEEWIDEYEGDKSTTILDNKGHHVLVFIILGTVVFGTAVPFAIPWLIAAGVLLMLGILWEVKDALYPREKAIEPFGINLGGDGFSWRDIVANIMGMGIATVVIYLITLVI